MIVCVDFSPSNATLRDIVRVSNSIALTADNPAVTAVEVDGVRIDTEPCMSAREVRHAFYKGKKQGTVCH